MHGDALTNGGGVATVLPPPPAGTTTLPTTPVPQQTNGGVAANILNVKDSRWLQLEVCREFQRGQCSRNDQECKFAHPPPHVEIQNGRVTACYDSIKGRCTRDNPKCKYLHPPQHLKDQLLINGRNNLVLKNLLANQLTAAQISTQPMSFGSLAAMPGTSALIPNIAATYNPYATYALNAATLYPGLLSASADQYGMLNGFVPAANTVANWAAFQKIASNTNANRLERVEALNSPMNKRSAYEKGGVPMMQQAIYQTLPANFGGMPYQTFTLPAGLASYMIPAASIAGNPGMARF